MKLQVGVKVLLKNSDGKILMLRRSEEKYGKVKGSWDIVGGRINPGTSLLENLRREVQEETKLFLISEPRLLAAQDIIPNDDRHIVRLTYVSETIGEPQLDTEENTEFKWSSLKEIQQDPETDMYVLQLIQKGILKESSWE